jgi:serine/threonine-protein kinase
LEPPPTSTARATVVERTRQIEPAAESALPSEWLRVAVAGQAGVHSGASLADQLRRRLRAVAVIQLCCFGAFLALMLVTQVGEFVAGTSTLVPSRTTAAMFVTTLICTCLQFGCCLLLSGRRPATRLRLRLAEALIIVPFAAFFSFGQILSAWKVAKDWPNLAPAVMLAQGEVLPWVVMMVAYGVLIPNVWRRCAAVLAGFAAVALVSHGIAYTLYPLRFELVATMLVMKAVWLGAAGAVVVYGAYRVQVLREREQQARELGQYRLGRRLGGGGMGEVYLAEHRMLRRPAALKIIRPGRAIDPAYLARFEREVQCTATLTHPNTVQIFDYGRTDDGTFYYVMEYLPGLNLEDLVRLYGPLAPARAVHFLHHVCAALGEAHAAGLVHRDLKPSNMMVCERGGVPDTVKLLDFGLVLPSGDDLDAKLTRQTGVTGTPAFIAPEQAGRQDVVDGRSDIYSLGATAYFLLTGRAPFADRSAAQVLKAHLHETPEPLARHRPDVPASLEAVVLRCLAKAPADRFPDVRSLDAALTDCRDTGEWTERDAADWWRQHSGSVLTGC